MVVFKLIHICYCVSRFGYYLKIKDHGNNFKTAVVNISSQL